MFLTDTIQEAALAHGAQNKGKPLCWSLREPPDRTKCKATIFWEQDSYRSPLPPLSAAAPMAAGELDNGGVVAGM